MFLKEPIDILFKVENLLIESDTWSVLCIPGFSIAEFYNGESIQKTEKQEYTFRVKTKDIVDYDIKEGDIFSYLTDSYIYTFQIPNDKSYKPIDDMTGAGLSKFSANFISREII